MPTMPSISVATAFAPLAPALTKVVDGVVRVDRLARVAPEALEHVVLHRPLVDVPVVHVGDLELAAAGRLEVGDHLEDVGS